MLCPRTRIRTQGVSSPIMSHNHPYFGRQTCFCAAIKSEASSAALQINITFVYRCASCCCWLIMPLALPFFLCEFYCSLLSALLAVLHHFGAPAAVDPAAPDGAAACFLGLCFRRYCPKNSRGSSGRCLTTSCKRSPRSFM